MLLFTVFQVFEAKGIEILLRVAKKAQERKRLYEM